MWPLDSNWDKRLSQRPDNVSLAGEAGIADSNYLSNLVGSTNVGVGQLSGLARQWEASHSKAMRLLKEELRSLSSQRSEAEIKRRRILDEDAFGAAASEEKRSILLRPGNQSLEEEAGVVQEIETEAKVCLKEESLELGLDQGEGDDHHEEQDQVEYWKAKVKKLGQLLAESLQREEILLKKLESKSGKPDKPVTEPLVNELQSQLERVDNYMHFVLKNAPIFLGHQDKDLKYRFMYNNHPKWQSEVIGKTDLELLSHPGGAMTHNFKKEVLRRGCPAMREFVYDTKEFGYKVFLVFVEPVFTKDGESIGINVVSVDLTDEAANREKLIRLREEEAVQRAMETQLHKTMRITEETMKAKQLLATMSHEIRSPLSGVVSMAEILAATDLDPEQQNLVDIMVSSGDLVMQLINDILDLSKAESGAMKLEATKFRPREVVRNVLQIAAASLRNRELILEGTVSADVPVEVIADVLRVRQVLTNLVSNAIKFTRQGSVRVDIRVTDKKQNHRQNGHSLECSSSPTPATDAVWLEFRISDTGIGIPDAALPFLFTKYMQASETHARKYGGTGLGLAICKQLVELMGGKLEVDSKEKKGSTFMFTLPCKLCEASPRSNGAQASSHFSFNTAESTTRSRKSSSSMKRTGSNGVVGAESCSLRKESPHRNGGAVVQADLPERGYGDASSTAVTATIGNSLKILLAEDTRVNIMVAQSMLRRLGLQATVVNDGAEAVAAIKKEHYDLILMDVIMPGMNGLEATRVIRDWQGRQGNDSKRTTIVALTANALPDDVAECYSHGMDSFIAKPVHFSKLQQAINQFFPFFANSAASSSSSSSPSSSSSSPSLSPSPNPQR